jgi:hypothetical protein
MLKTSTAIRRQLLQIQDSAKTPKVCVLILYSPGVANPFRHGYAEISFLAHIVLVFLLIGGVYRGHYPLAQVSPDSPPLGPILPGARLATCHASDLHWRDISHGAVMCLVLTLEWGVNTKAWDDKSE